jgi:hypothetical protein
MLFSGVLEDLNPFSRPARSAAPSRLANVCLKVGIVTANVDEPCCLPRFIETPDGSIRPSVWLGKHPFDFSSGLHGVFVYRSHVALFAQSNPVEEDF